VTRVLASLGEVAGDYDAIVLDQWGVLHDGTRPYPGAVAAVERLAHGGMRLAVLSNSGKRADVNTRRIADMGFAPGWFEVVMTSGEALWQDFARGTLIWHTLMPIAAAAIDAPRWAAGLDVTLTRDVAAAEAVLLMGLADDAPLDAVRATLDAALARSLPLICSNPDRLSPRADGGIVVSPGALAHDYADAGGDVSFYGKPHGAVFAATARALGDPARLLMVGDSPEHDIAGGQHAGWATCLVQGGLHAAEFADGPPAAVAADLCAAIGAAPPDHVIAAMA
jgi:HAD superfamily hydrolase (TIGR01459 family)